MTFWKLIFYLPYNLNDAFEILIFFKSYFALTFIFPFITVPMTFILPFTINSHLLLSFYSDSWWFTSKHHLSHRFWKLTHCFHSILYYHYCFFLLLRLEIFFCLSKMTPNCDHWHEQRQRIIKILFEDRLDVVVATQHFHGLWQSG